LRCEAATPGPWDSGRGNDRSNTVCGSDGLEITVRKPGAFYSDYKDDDAFIAHARTGLPAALDALDTAEGRIAEPEAEVARLENALDESLQEHP
jgi:hypothetical protein